MKRLILILMWAVLVAGAGVSVQAAPADGAVTSADARRVRAVVQAQIDAFAADDA